jgi:peptidoglycan/xylan/chitin deacetylase (PgdA/CDA1 family)
MSPETGHSQHSDIITLAFHKIHTGFSYGSTNYSPGRFFDWISAIEDSGLPVRISFDDGYAHLQEILPKLIGRLAAPPIVFVPSAWIGRSNDWDYSSLFRKEFHLSADQIRGLAGLGVTFGSHGHNHRDLTALSETELKSELIQSKIILTELSGRSVVELSYPFGRYSDRVQQAAASAGYEAGFTMTFPTSNDSALRQGRIPIYSFDSQAAVFRRLRQGRGYSWERLKVTAVSALSGGTILLNRWRGM